MGWGLKSVFKAVTNIVKPVAKVAIPAAIGFAVGGPVGAAAGVGVGLMKNSLKKAVKTASPGTPETPPESPSLATKRESGMSVLEEATSRAAKEAAAARGRASTMTGAGDTEDDKYNARKRLLGY